MFLISPPFSAVGNESSVSDFVKLVLNFTCKEIFATNLTGGIKRSDGQFRNSLETVILFHKFTLIIGLHVLPPRMNNYYNDF